MYKKSMFNKFAFLFFQLLIKFVNTTNED